MSPEQTQTHQLSVSGMSCQHCVRAVTQAVVAVDPQAQVKVDLPLGLVVVDSHATREQIAAAIAEEGYTVAV